MTDSAKRARLAVTYVPGQGCELDQALSALVQFTGRTLRKGDIRELVILGALAKQAGFAAARMPSGGHALVPMNSVASSFAANSVVTVTTSAPAAAAPSVRSPTSSVATAVVEPAGKQQAANDAGQQVEVNQQTPSQSPIKTKPVTVAARSSNAAATNPKQVPIATDVQPKTDFSNVESTVNSSTVTDSVTVNPLTSLSEETQESADTSVMTVAEGEALLDLALKF